MSICTCHCRNFSFIGPESCAEALAAAVGVGKPCTRVTLCKFSWRTASVLSVPGPASPHHCWTTRTKFHLGVAEGWITGCIITPWPLQRQLTGLVRKGDIDHDKFVVTDIPLAELYFLSSCSHDKKPYRRLTERVLLSGNEFSLQWCLFNR